jgi:hypothetical protein
MIGIVTAVLTGSAAGLLATIAAGHSAVAGFVTGGVVSVAVLVALVWFQYSAFAQAHRLRLFENEQEKARCGVMGKIDVPLAWVPLTTVKGSAGRPPPGRLVARAAPPLTCTDGSCRFLWVLALRQPVWLRWWGPAGGRPAPRRFSRLPEGGPGVRGQRPEAVQRFALRRVGEDSCPSTAGASSCLRPERAAAVGGGRRTMDEDVRWFPGAPAGLTPR